MILVILAVNAGGSSLAVHRWRFMSRVPGLESLARDCFMKVVYFAWSSTE